MTPYSDVFKAFLAEVRDTYYVVEPDAVDAAQRVAALEDHMISLLHKAIVRFSYPRVDIRDIDDEAQVFNATLGLDEIEILATGMVVNWARGELYNIDILRQTMTTKDFNTYSQAPHINALTRVADYSDKRLKKMLVRYSLRNPAGGSTLVNLGSE